MTWGFWVLAWFAASVVAALAIGAFIRAGNSDD